MMKTARNSYKEGLCLAGFHYVFTISDGFFKLNWIDFYSSVQNYT